MLERMKKNLWIWVSAGIFILSAGVIVALDLLGIVSLTPSGSKITIAPTMMTGVEVEPDSAFLLTGTGTMDEAMLRAQIKLTPDLHYRLTPQTAADGATGFLMSFQKPLPAGERFTMVVGGKTNNYQITKTLLVNSAMPVNGSTGVSPSSGIEFDFNATDVTITDLQKAFSITPTVEGDFSQGNGKLVFYPDGKGSMGYDTTYTVTLDASLSSPGGLKLREPYILSFTTISQSLEEKSSLFTISGSTATYNTLTSEVPQLSVYFAQEALVNEQPPELAINIYDMGDEQQYLEAVTQSLATSAYGAYRPDVTKLPKTSSFLSQPMLVGDETNRGGKNSSILQFPEKLPAGRYLAEISYDTKEKLANGDPLLITRYMLVQSSDLSVFFMHTGKDILLWVNDAATGLPVQGATFELDGDIGATLTTGADGTALLTNADSLFVEGWDKKSAFIVRAGDRALVDGRYFSETFSFGLPEQKFTSYLFTDRPLYQTTDTIKVWGMIRPRRDTIKLPDDLTLQLDGVDPVAVKPDAKGFFTTEIKLNRMSGSTYTSLQLMVGDQALAHESLRIFDYVKPIYTSTTRADKPVYIDLPGQPKPSVSLDVTLFDGTPVPGFRGTLSNNSSSLVVPDGVLTADAKGHIGTAVSVNNAINTWYPQRYGFEFLNADAEDENFMNSGYIDYIHRDLMLETKLTFADGNPTVEVLANRVDISKIKEPSDLWHTDNLRGEALAVPMTAKLQKITFEKILQGTSYDYINMVSVPYYTYERIETTEKTYNFSTKAGTHSITDLPKNDPEDRTSYYLLIEGKDSQNRVVETTVWLRPEWNARGDDATARYGLGRVVDSTKLAAKKDDDGTYRFDDEWFLRTRFGDKETVRFQLTNNDEPVEKMTGRVLWSTVQTSIENVTVTDEKELTLPFSENLLPNYTITGAYFDGKHIFALEDSGMYFDAETRALAVALDAGKDTFDPGEAVTITATVTEAASKKPAGDAQVVVAVVDEAIFAIQEQYVDLPRELYDMVFYPNIAKYASYNGPGYSGPGEKGGGGGENPIREKFQDTALFATGRTDANGKLKLNFTLPDNITSWRMTSLAITDKNWGGNTKSNIIATRDFYVTPMVNSTILGGDDFVVGLRGAGRAVAEADQVQYTVTVESDKKQVQTLTSGLRDYGWVTFPGLPLGDYTVVIRGECKDYNDTVRLPFSVIATGIETAQVKTVNLATPLTLSPLRYPVMMTVYDKNMLVYNRVRENLLYTNGPRADMRVAQAYLYDTMAADGNVWYGLGEKQDLSDLHNTVISLLPYSPKDWDITAKLYLALPDMFPMETESMRFWVDKTSTPESWDAATGSDTSFMILRALMGEYAPVDPLTATGSYVEKLNLAIAAAVQGDTKLAQTTYDTLVTPNLKTLTGVSGETVVYIPGQGADSEKESTAAALRLALVLDTKDADPLMSYLLQKQSYYDPYIAEQLLYMTRKQSSGGGAKASYTLDGKNVPLVLNDSVTLPPLSKNQLENLKPKVQSGEVYADVYYTAAATSADITKKKIPVIKTIAPVEGNEFKVGGLVKVTITPDLAGFDKGIGESDLVIDDYLPTGIKFEAFNSAKTEAWSIGDWWLNLRQNQRLRFTAQTENGKFTSVSYFARCAYPGSYKVEGSFVSSGSGAVWGSSDAWTLTILP